MIEFVHHDCAGWSVCRASSNPRIVHRCFTLRICDADQDEVALRLVAGPTSGLDYRAMNVEVAFYSNPTYLFQANRPARCALCRTSRMLLISFFIGTSRGCFCQVGRSLHSCNLSLQLQLQLRAARDYTGIIATSSLSSGRLRSSLLIVRAGRQDSLFSGTQC